MNVYLQQNETKVLTFQQQITNKDKTTHDKKNDSQLAKSEFHLKD